MHIYCQENITILRRGWRRLAKIPRAVFRYVEHELYNYDLTCSELEQLREEIISTSASPGYIVAGAGGEASDSTGAKAVKLITNVAIARMVRTLSAIDRALMRLQPYHRKLFELKYRKCKPWQEICMEMHIEERTYFKYRRELVVMVALEMGFVSHAEIMQF